VLLDDEAALEVFGELAQRLAQARVPGCAAGALRLGRMVAPSKTSGEMKGIVTGDVFRRMLAHTMAQQLSQVLHSGCSPFQYALSTRAGAECMAHTLRVVTETSPTTTALSIDGVSAFDQVSRQSMLSNLRALPVSCGPLPFARLFYGHPYTYLWYDAEGRPMKLGRRRGEQGDPLMPALFALGQHPALASVQRLLKPGGTVFACWDDNYIVREPDRVPFYMKQSDKHCGSMLV
jgi:hypothetical protein